jgi:methylated-DNA-[protein]-cysteine S-methyltransferase
MTTPLPDGLDERFRGAAEAARLVDVAYDLADSPVGELLVAVTDRGLCRISFEGEAALDEVARTLSPRVLRVPRRLGGVRRELDEYFEGRRRDFDLDVDLTGLPAFQQRVLHELARVPFGEITTYGALAARVGNPRAARAVGGALNRNPVPLVLPCHRVVGSTGSLVGYAGGLHRKRALIDLERGISALA